MITIPESVGCDIAITAIIDAVRGDKVSLPRSEISQSLCLLHLTELSHYAYVHHFTQWHHHILFYIILQNCLILLIFSHFCVDNDFRTAKFVISL